MPKIIVRSEEELERKITGLMTDGVQAILVTRGQISSWVLSGAMMDRVAKWQQQAERKQRNRRT